MTPKNIPYFIWLEDKMTDYMMVDPRRTIPLSHMRVAMRRDGLYHPIFTKTQYFFPRICDGPYLYAFLQDGSLNMFAGRISFDQNQMARIIDQKIMDQNHEKILSIASQRYGIDFKMFPMIHSILAQGQNVLCAGEVLCVSGHIKYINNYSGHYFPTAYQLYNTLFRINELYPGIFTSSAYVKDFDFDVMPLHQFLTKYTASQIKTMAFKIRSG